MRPSYLETESFDESSAPGSPSSGLGRRCNAGS